MKIASRQLLSIALLLVMGVSVFGNEKIKVLIIDGQNNHETWPKTTMLMKHFLEQSNLFTVDVARTKFTWKGEKYLADFSLTDGVERQATPQPKTDPDFQPDFSKYQVILSNFGWNAAPWPETTQKAFEAFLSNGGGLVIIHAANNSFGDWDAYNKMIGIGGWGGRNEKSGPYFYLNDKEEPVVDKSPGNGGSHGPQHEYEVVIRNPDHPITRGLPRNWLHAKDELYDRLRGPGENMEILATAYSDSNKGGSGRHEPILITIQYGKGRIFHNPMGDNDQAMECVGFIETLVRGTEWAATGHVTSQQAPEDFPTADKSSIRKFETK